MIPSTDRTTWLSDRAEATTRAVDAATIQYARAMGEHRRKGRVLTRALAERAYIGECVDPVPADLTTSRAPTDAELRRANDLDPA